MSHYFRRMGNTISTHLRNNIQLSDHDIIGHFEFDNDHDFVMYLFKIKAHYAKKFQKCIN